MKTPDERPTLLPNIERDLALKAVPEEANVQIFTADKKEMQTVPELLPGTGLKGKVDFGDQVGARRLKVGDALLVMGCSSEAWFAVQVGDARPQELLVLKRLTRPLSDFR